jgi:hypothetical protein
MSRYSDDIIETPAFCPKAIAGLSDAKVPAQMKSRMIIHNMQPATEDQVVVDDIDKDTLDGLCQQIDECCAIEIDQLKTVEIENNIEGLNKNRDWHICRPLLAVAKLAGDEWFARALNAVKFFMEKNQDGDKVMAHKVLLYCYKIFRSGDDARNPDKIHKETLEINLHGLGIPQWVDIGEILKSYDPRIRTQQMKIDGINKYGYDWHSFFPTWNRYLSDKEKRDVEKEIGLLPLEVAKVAPVAVAPGTQTERYTEQW